MKIEEVRQLSTVDRFLYWIRERERVRVAKDRGKPKPWTDDPIILRFKFCNVRRMDDRVSRWLMENWYEPFYNHPNMLTACTLARQLNNTESLEAVGFPKKWDPKRVQNILDERVKNGLKNFAAAYMITGTLGGTKIEQVVWKVVTPIHQRPPKPLITASLEELHASLTPFAGFSGFIAGQVAADLRHGLSGSWIDAKYWAPMGPGSKRGLNRLMGQPKDAKINKKEFPQLLRDEVISLCKTYLSRTINNRLEAIDYQNCLCEWDKYERTLWGEGRPKQRYQGI